MKIPNKGCHYSNHRSPFSTPQAYEYIVSNQILPAKHYNHDDATHHADEQKQKNKEKIDLDKSEKIRVFILCQKIQNPNHSIDCVDDCIVLNASANLIELAIT